MELLNNKILQYLFFAFFIFCFCQHKITERKLEQQVNNIQEAEILPGCCDLPKYFSKIKGKRIGLVVHPCSVIGNSFLLDSFLHLGIEVRKIFVPEHGFRGNADAGEDIQNGIDERTGIPLISLYGKSKKPSEKNFEGLDLIVFDLQDVGVRFYTYLSSLHYIMESCAEQNKELIVLDRPNPNGFYVDGPVLESDCKSFIGLHPIPIVHGMTLGELAMMIKSEGWINRAAVLQLSVVKCLNFTHESHYKLPIKPSPNLPNNLSILLYPSLCLLEGTIVSLGRGTDFPFQIFGHPDFNHFDTTFIPQTRTGAKNPPLLGKTCKGFTLIKLSEESLNKRNKLNLEYIKSAINELNYANDFFLENNFINLLAGNKDFKNQISSNKSDEEIRKTWKPKLDSFKVLRKKYLLYKDFQ